MNGHWVKHRSTMHTCEMPWGRELVFAKIGDIWMCDDCETKYQIVNMKYPDRPATLPLADWGDGYK